ncbi:unnamed protein product [Symbiodinium microadriaticum]|nr:unnamed protein product [Symbiodinium microadriaticum]
MPSHRSRWLGVAVLVAVLWTSPLQTFSLTDFLRNWRSYVRKYRGRKFSIRWFRSMCEINMERVQWWDQSFARTLRDLGDEDLEYYEQCRNTSLALISAGRQQTDACPELRGALDLESDTHPVEVLGAKLQSVAHAGHLATIQRCVSEAMIAELHETRLLLRKVSKILDFSQLQKMDIERLVQQLDGIAQMEAKDKGSFVHIRFDLVERGMSVIHGIPHARRQWEQRYKYWKSQVPSAAEVDWKRVGRQTIVNIFDWGRSELNTIHKQASLSDSAQADRAEYWSYYAGGIYRLSWEASRAYLHQFGNAEGWQHVSFMIWDFDSMSDNDFMGKVVEIPLQETKETTAKIKLNSRIPLWESWLLSRPLKARIIYLLGEPLQALNVAVQGSKKDIGF